MNTKTRQVIAIGSKCYEAASLLAERRNASITRIESIESLVANPELLIADITFLVGELWQFPAQETADLYSALLRKDPSKELTFITGESPEKVFYSANKVRPEPSVGGDELYVADSIGLGIYSRQIKPVTDLTSNDGLDRTALIGCSIDVLFIFAHSNGLDMGAGGSIVLCRREGQLPDSSNLRGFPCFHGAPCAMPLQNKLQAPLGLVNAKRIIASTCFAISPSSKPFSPELTLGAGFLDMPETEVIVGAMTVVHIDETIANLFTYLSLSGLAFATIVSRVNQYLVSRGMPPRFCCFGDGETRIRSKIQDLKLFDRSPSSASVAVRIREGQRSADIRAGLPTNFFDATRKDEAFVGTGMSGAIALNLKDCEVFLSITPQSISDAKGVLSLRMVPLDQIRRRLLQLVDDLLFLEDLIVELASMPFTCVEGVTKLRQLTKKMSQWIARHAFIRKCRPGQVFLARDFIGVVPRLEQRIKEVQSALVELHIAVSKAEGAMPPFKYWTRSYELNSYINGRKKCDCLLDPSPVETVLYKSTTRHSSRLVEHCIACGPIADRSKTCKLKLNLPQKINRGQSLPISVFFQDEAERNPIMRGSVAIRRFDALDIIHCSLVQAPSNENGAYLLTGEIMIPHKFFRGVYYVGVMVAEDLQVSFLRQPIFID